jgi:hypothetical protein
VNVAVGSGDGVAVGATVEVGSGVDVHVGTGVVVGTTVGSDVAVGVGVAGRGVDVGAAVGSGVGGVPHPARSPIPISRNSNVRNAERVIRFLSICAFVCKLAYRFVCRFV